MKFSLDRKYLATAGEDGIINIWKVRNDSHKSWDGHIFEEEPIRSFTGHTVLYSIIYIKHRTMLWILLGQRMDLLFQLH